MTHEDYLKLHKNYVRVPTSFRDLKLNIYEFLVLEYILQWDSLPNKQLAYSYIAGGLNISSRSVQRSVEALLEYQYITKGTHKGVNTYRVNFQRISAKVTVLKSERTTRK